MWFIVLDLDSCIFFFVSACSDYSISVGVSVCSACLQVMLLELQNSLRDNTVGDQSARCSKRRKLNVVDVDLNDRVTDTFLAQIVAILQMCLVFMPIVVFLVRTPCIMPVFSVV